MEAQQFLHSEYVRVGNLDIRYFTGGSGYPLVVIHGGAGGADTWLKQAQYLTRRYRVYIPDLPGFGLSSGMGDFDVNRYAQFVDDFATALGLNKFNLVGHSMGGSIAGAYAIKFPAKTHKLVLVDSVGLGKEIIIWARLGCWAFAGVFKGTVQGLKWLVKHFHPDVESIAIFSTFSLSIGLALMNLEGQKVSLLEDLSTLLVPTLLIWGAKDPVVPVAHGYAASKVIPQCQLKIFDNCGHSAYQQETKEFCRVLTDFCG